MSRRFALAAAAVLLTGAGQDVFSLSVAESLSHEALERRVLQASQPTAREVRIFDFPLYLARDTAFEIQFANQPRAAEYPGLCSAEVTIASFGPNPRSFTAETPVRLLRAEGSRRFALSVDDLMRGTRVPAERCAAMGRVLVADSHFFNGSDGSRELSEREAYAGIAAIRTMIAQARDGALETGCEEDVFAQFWKDIAPLCTDRPKWLSQLRWESLSYLKNDYCGSGLSCIFAVFDRPGAPQAAMKVHLDLRVRDLRFQPDGSVETGKIESATMTGVTHVD